MASLFTAFAIAEFDQLKGSTIKCKYPRFSLKLGDEELANICLPDGAHQVSQDITYMILKEEDGAVPTLYGISVFHNRRDAQARRGAEQVALLALLPIPIFNVIEGLLHVILDEYMERKGDEDVIVSAFNTISASIGKVQTIKFGAQIFPLPLPVPEYGIDRYGGASLCNLILTFEKKTILLWYALMLERRLIFRGSRSHAVGALCLAAPLLIAPLVGLAHYTYPYVSLTSFIGQVEHKKKYICGATNALFEEKTQWSDFLALVDAKVVKVHGAKPLSASSADKAFMRETLVGVRDQKMGEEWAMQRFWKRTTEVIATLESGRVKDPVHKKYLSGFLTSPLYLSYSKSSSAKTMIQTTEATATAEMIYAEHANGIGVTPSVQNRDKVEEEWKSLQPQKPIGFAQDVDPRNNLNISINHSINSSINNNNNDVNNNSGNYGSNYNGSDRASLASQQQQQRTPLRSPRTNRLTRAKMLVSFGDQQAEMIIPIAATWAALQHRIKSQFRIEDRISLRCRIEPAPYTEPSLEDNVVVSTQETYQALCDRLVSVSKYGGSGVCSAVVNVLPRLPGAPVASVSSVSSHAQAMISMKAVPGFVKIGDATSGLHVAARKGDKQRVHQLVLSGGGVGGVGSIPVDIRDHEGQTPLHFAVWEGHVEVVQLLVSLSADVNARDVLAVTPLHCAASRGYVDIMKILLSHGARLNLQDENGWTALHRAATLTDPALIRLLVEASSDVSSLSKGGWSALHVAARYSSSDCVECLLANYASVFTADVHDKRAWEIALERGGDEGHKIAAALQRKASHLHVRLVNRSHDFDDATMHKRDAINENSDERKHYYEFMTGLSAMFGERGLSKKAAFMYFDTDRDGLISVEELQEGLMKFGFNFSFSQTNTLFSQIQKFGILIPDMPGVEPLLSPRVSLAAAEGIDLDVFIRSFSRSNRPASVCFLPQNTYDDIIVTVLSLNLDFASFSNSSPYSVDSYVIAVDLLKQSKEGVAGGYGSIVQLLQAGSHALILKDRSGSISVNHTQRFHLSHKKNEYLYTAVGRAMSEPWHPVPLDIYLIKEGMGGIGGVEIAKASLDLKQLLASQSDTSSLNLELLAASDGFGKGERSVGRCTIDVTALAALEHSKEKLVVHRNRSTSSQSGSPSHNSNSMTPSTTTTTVPMVQISSFYRQPPQDYRWRNPDFNQKFIPRSSEFQYQVEQKW